MVSLLNDMSILFRDLLIFKLSPGSGLLNAGFDSTALSTLSDKTVPEQLFFCLDVLKSAIAGLSRSGSSKLTVELCLIRMCNEHLVDSTAAMLSRISQLEKGNPGPSLNRIINKESAELTAPVNHIANADTAEAVIIEPTAPPTKPDEPETPTAPHTEPAQEKSGCFWTDTLKMLESEPSVHVLLNDSSIVQGKQNDNILTIFSADSFTAGLIEIESTTQLIKEAAKKVLCEDVVIRTELVDTIVNNESKRGKLESLSAFDIVSFE